LLRQIKNLSNKYKNGYNFKKNGQVSNITTEKFYTLSKLSGTTAEPEAAHQNLLNHSHLLGLGGYYNIYGMARLINCNYQIS
jgi:hypothetical protein